MKPAIAAFLLLLALAPAPERARAAEEPEAVYAKFHAALHAHNVPEMQRYGTAAGGKEMAEMPPVQRKAILEFLSNLMPKTYNLVSKDISPDGNSATLRLTAQQKSLDGKPETIQGIVAMVKQGGEWKVDKSSWGDAAKAKPSAAAPAARPAPKAQAATPAPKPQAAAPARKAPVVGSMDAAPERRLGAAKAPCVYKPVMTNEDIEACR